MQSLVTHNSNDGVSLLLHVLVQMNPPTATIPHTLRAPHPLNPTPQTLSLPVPITIANFYPLPPPPLQLIGCPSKHAIPLKGRQGFALLKHPSANHKPSTQNSLGDANAG